MRKPLSDILTGTPYSADTNELFLSKNYLHTLTEGSLLAIYDSKYGDISTAKKVNRLEFVRVKQYDSSNGKLNVDRAQMGSLAINFDDHVVWNVVLLPNISSDETDVTEYGARADVGFDSTDDFLKMAEYHELVCIQYRVKPYVINYIDNTHNNIYCTQY